MPNLFISTRFDFAEEDRLTNALMSVLEHCDRRVLSRFLSLAVGDSIAVDESDEVHFDLQVRLPHSRPDARVRLPGRHVYIETKTGSGLDDRGQEQLRQHHAALRRKNGRDVLVALTSARRPPDLVRELAAVDPTLAVRHLSWGDVLRLFVELQDDFDPGEATHLLLLQMEEYLRHSGFFYYEGIPMTDILDYAAALRSVRNHERTTRRQLEGLLQWVIDELSAQPGIPTRGWKIDVFKGEDRFGQYTTSFQFVTAGVPDLGPAAHFRVLPKVHTRDGFTIPYYFTYQVRTDAERALVQWLHSHRSEIERETGKLVTFGDTGERLFHMTRVVARDVSDRVLTGERGAVTELAREVGAYFAAIYGWLVIGQAQSKGQPAGG